MDEKISDEESKDSKNSEDSDEDEENEKYIADILLYKQKIEDNEMDYDAHVGLIKSLRSLGELEELRKARQGMNRVYPLSPELWLEWLSDEQKVCSSGEERNFIHEIFKLAVKEYTSIQVWVEYIMFMLGGGNREETKRVCEDALTAVGIHLAEGILVWQAVILVEQQFFQGFFAEAEKELEEQKKKIQTLYRRQARVPLMNMNKEEFLTEAQNWFNGEVDIQLAKDLDTSYKKMQEKLPFEDALLRARDETEKLEAYRKYIDHVRLHDNPALIQNVYERTVTELCLNAGIWEEYVRFVMDQFSSAPYVILPVCERSLLNCPWSSALFQLHMTALQRFPPASQDRSVRADIKGSLEKVLRCAGKDEAEVVRSWMSYLVYLRREIHWDQPSRTHQLSDFREACEQALSYIEERLGEAGDPDCTVARFEARVEAESAKDMEAARATWNEHIMKRSNNFKRADLWLEFINLERCYGDVKRCRKLFRRATERVWDGIEAIGAAYLEFEQELGSLDTMADFEKRYRDRLLIVQKKAIDDALKEEKKKTQLGRNKSKARDEGRVLVGSPQQKKITALAVDRTEVNMPTTSKGVKRSLPISPPPGFEEAAAEPKAKKQKGSAGHGESIQHDSMADPRTVFLSNLDYNAEESDILAVFDDCGPIESFRIAKDFRGRSKGFGYLVFKDESSVPKALTKDRAPVGTRPLFVSPCNPKSKDHAFKFSTGLENDKLFVKGIPLHLSQEDIRVVFEPHGIIKSLRLATHRNGHSKGTCYIDYFDVGTAQKAMKAMNGFSLEGKTISVMVSNPSAARSASKSEGAASERLSNLTASTGGRPRPATAPVRGRQRPQLSLMPRSLLRKTTQSHSQNGDNATNGNSEDASSVASSSKSNQDFRNLFLK